MLSEETKELVKQYIYIRDNVIKNYMSMYKTNSLG